MITHLGQARPVPLVRREGGSEMISTSQLVGVRGGRGGCGSETIRGSYQVFQGEGTDTKPAEVRVCQYVSVGCYWLFYRVYRALLQSLQGSFAELTRLGLF